MPNPIEGKQYTVKSGDTLSSIAKRVYGDAKEWPRIWKANQSEIKSGNPDQVFPGEKIIIPEDPALKDASNPSVAHGKEKDQLTIIIDGLEITPQAARIIRTMDTVADGATVTIPWTPNEDVEIDKRLLPYEYPKCQVAIGGDTILTGFVYGISPSMTDTGMVKNIEIWSATADIIDSTMRPPYEANNVTLKQRAEHLLGPIGLSVVFDCDAGGPFERVTAEPTEAIFEHLLKLAMQRGVLISSTPDGNLLFTKAKVEGEPVGTLEETQPMPIGWEATFDGRKRFNSYRAIGQNSGWEAKTAIAKDDNVPRSRFMAFSADDTTTGDIKKAAEWRRSKQLSEALTIPFPVAGWLAPNGSVWKENTLVTVISKTIHVPNGFTFIIGSVEFEFGSSGKIATLKLVPPHAYTGNQIKDEWA